MLISTWAVPLPDTLLGVADAGEICHPDFDQDNLLHGLNAVGQTPEAAILPGITGIIGAVQSILGQSPAQQIASEQAKQEHALLLAQKQQAAQEFASQELQAQLAPSEQKRATEIYALYAIGGIAAIITLSFVIATVRKGSK